MSYLQLAENDPYNKLAEDNPMKNYIFIPAGMLGMSSDTYVREDFFDGLNADDYQKTIEMLAPYQNQGLSFIPGIGAIASTGFKVASNLLKRRQERVAAGTAKPLFKAGGKISNLIGKLKDLKGKTQTDENTQPPGQTKAGPFDVDINADLGDKQLQLQYGQGQPQETFFKKYKTPLLIGGGLLVAGGLYLALRKKKRR